MSDTTIRPVFIRYPKDANGYLAGSTFEIPTPEQAWVQHPDADIVSYADGTEYSDRKARAEVRERDRAESPDAPVKRSKGSATRSRAKKGQDTPDVEIIVPAAPDVAETMLTDDLEDDDGTKIVVDVVDVPDERE